MNANVVGGPDIRIEVDSDGVCEDDLSGEGRFKSHIGNKGF